MEAFKKQASLALYAFFPLLLLCSTVIKPSPSRWILWLPIAVIGYHLFFYNPTEDSAFNAGLRLPIVTYTLVASDYILLTDVQHEFRRVGQHQPISTAPFLARLNWALRLLFGPRGVGWTHEPTSVLPPKPHLTRSRFIMYQVCRLVVYILVVDIVYYMTRYTSFFEKDSRPITLEVWYRQIWGIFLLVIRSISFLSMLHITASIVTVALQISEPSGWPDMFGRLSDAYTIRRFWGRTWHQMLRRVITSHAKYLARLLHVPAGSNISSFVQLCAAFFVTGVIHSQPSDTRPFFFFLSQVIAISFEDAVLKLAANAGYVTPNRIHKFIGFIWVCCWFIYSIPPWMDSVISSGALEPGSGFGIIDWVIRRMRL